MHWQLQTDADGVAWLTIDKARASVAGTNGDFHYNCPMDQRFWAFTGIKPAAFL